MHGHPQLTLIFWEQREVLWEFPPQRCTPRTLDKETAACFPAACLFAKNHLCFLCICLSISVSCLSSHTYMHTHTHTQKKPLRGEDMKQLSIWNDLKLNQHATTCTWHTCSANLLYDNSLMSQQPELSGAIKIFSTTCLLAPFHKMIYSTSEILLNASMFVSCWAFGHVSNVPFSVNKYVSEICARPLILQPAGFFCILFDWIAHAALVWRRRRIKSERMKKAEQIVKKCSGLLPPSKWRL